MRDLAPAPDEEIAEPDGLEKCIDEDEILTDGEFELVEETVDAGESIV